MQNMNRYLFGTVFLTGAAVLILEIAAVRILTPYYGSSLQVFSSVLTVILAALSIGYWYGGKRADEYHSIDELYALIASSGLLVLLLLLLATAILPTFGHLLPVSIGPLVFSCVLFFLPAFILGIVSPYIIKLQSMHTPSTEIGEVVGKTFFWGTVGSIVGSIASGFWLIPSLGVELSIIFVSIILISVGIVTPLLLNRPIRKKWSAGVLILILIFGSCLFILTTQKNNSVVHQSNGIYSSITITDMDIYDKPARLLKRDTNNSSAIFRNSTDLVFDYTQFIHLYTTLKPDATTMLMLGGGAYTIPRSIAASNAQMEIDVVEIEPVLFELAQEYFDLSDVSRITNYAEDARVFASRTETQYDIIFADLFSTNMAAPFHLTTFEYYTLLRDRLTEDGILIVNYVGKPTGESPSLTGSVIKTLVSVFPEIQGFMTNPNHLTRNQNIMFVARKSGALGQLPISLPSYGLPLVLADMKLDLTTYNDSTEYLLTDDHAPVDRLMAKQR